MIEIKIRVLVVCKTMPQVKRTCWLLFNDLISDYNLRGFTFNKSDHIIRFGTNEMYFASIDDPEKLKSFERINYVWGEEATGLTKADYIQLDLRCRGHNANSINQLFFSFNPIDIHSFLKPLTEIPNKKIGVCHSTYKDNAFNEPEYIETLESLIDQDDTYYKIYNLGQWATPTGMIFKNYDIIEKYPKYKDFEVVGYGLDFGFNNPSAILQLGIIDQVPYEKEMLYETHLTTGDIIEELKTIIPKEQRGDIIVADCSEPARIMEIKNAGFNCVPCKKGKDSVRRGIDLICAQRPQLDKNSPCLIKEIQGYKWRVDKTKTDEDGNPLPLDEPVKIFDHLMDARRYIYTNMMDKVKVGFAVLDDDSAKFVRNELEEAFELPEESWQDC